HQKIFAAILAMHQLGVGIDLVTLAEEINARGQAADVGGIGKLGEFWDAAPTAANVLSYARIVRDKALQRELIGLGTEIVADAYEPTMPAQELLEQAEKKLFGL